MVQHRECPLEMTMTTAKHTVKVLIAYFSRTGNTREVARHIHQSVGGDIIEIRPVTPYPEAYLATTEQAKKEQESNFRPQISAEVPDMDSYDVIFIGYPIWWGSPPMAVFAFLEAHDLSGKTVIPFCTHEGSHLGRSMEDIKLLCPDSPVCAGLDFHGGDSAHVLTDSARRDMAKWLKKLDFK